VCKGCPGKGSTQAATPTLLVLPLRTKRHHLPACPKPERLIWVPRQSRPGADRTRLPAAGEKDGTLEVGPPQHALPGGTGGRAARVPLPPASRARAPRASPASFGHVQPVPCRPPGCGRQRPPWRTGPRGSRCQQPRGRRGPNFLSPSPGAGCGLGLSREPSEAKSLQQRQPRDGSASPDRPRPTHLEAKPGCRRPPPLPPRPRPQPETH
jgi:hypothetical protein